jgi:tol-pal system protein YbgF
MLLRRLALAVALGCSFASQALAQSLFDDTEARRRIDTLRQQVDASQRAIEQRLAKIESAGTDRSAILELSGQISAVRDEIAQLRGKVEVLANQAEMAEKRQKDLYLDIDTRLRKLEQASEKAATAVPQTTEAVATPEENKAYQAALDQFKLGNYPLAVSAMQGFLVSYPKSPLAPNAQYWVGMAYSGQRDYKSAITEQRKVIAQWPDNPKAPDAMLSIASSQETMGDRRAAQKTLQELIERYPTSSAAASAKQRLAAASRR